MRRSKCAVPVAQEDATVHGDQIGVSVAVEVRDTEIRPARRCNVGSGDESPITEPNPGREARARHHEIGNAVAIDVDDRDARLRAADRYRASSDELDSLRIQRANGD